MILDRRALIGSGLPALGLSAWGMAVAGTGLLAAPTIARAAALPPAEGDMVLGSPKAKVQVVEYASLSCSHCADWNNEVFPDFNKQFIATGKVRYIFREFLTPPYDFAAAGYLLARRVGTDKYFHVVDAIFHDQRAIYRTGDFWGGLIKIGKDFGLTEAQVTAALEDQKALDAVNARVDLARTRDQIEVTPTFFVDGLKAEGGQSLEALAGAVAKASQAKPGQAKPGQAKPGKA